MILTWYGYACFKIETSGLTLAVDPFPKTIGLTPPRFRAELVLVTHDHPAHANIGAIPGVERVIAGPGEYEIRGVTIAGIQSFHDARGGRERGLNTIYRIEAGGISIVHCGDFGEEALRDETAEALGEVDLLLVPVGGRGHTVDGATAARIAARIEPRVVVPMHYRLPGLTAALDPPEPFLERTGAPRGAELEKLTLKKKDLSVGETRVVTLAPA